MTDGETVDRCALVVNGEVWALPRPARHHVLAYAWCQAHWRDGRFGRLGKHESGFLTTAGRYVGRAEAYSIALRAGQIVRPAEGGYQGDQLFSEDLW